MKKYWIYLIWPWIKKYWIYLIWPWIKKYWIYILIWPLLIVFIFLPLFAIVLGCNPWCLLSRVCDTLSGLYVNSDGFNLVNIVTFLGSSIALTLFYLRNKAMTAQTESQYKIFNEDKQFSNFLEATKLLTDKDSTTEAKIAAMFSLADVARDHPERLDRVIQTLNKQLIPLMKVIDGKNNTDKYTSTLKEKKVVKKPLALKKETELFACTQNKVVSYGEEKTNQKKIKDWQYKGSETEKVVSVALYVIRKIILELKNCNSNFDFSNTIFFDIDNTFDRSRIGNKFIRKDTKRIENAIFLDCKLKRVNFRKTDFHYCKFINCDLSEADFNDANLWGASFINCDFKGTIFKEAECEGIIFKDCKNLTREQLNEMKFGQAEYGGIIFKDCKNLPREQLNEMKFLNIEKVKEFHKNKNKNIKYLIIIDKKTLKNINNENNEEYLTLDNFLTKDEYSEWKNSDKD